MSSILLLIFGSHLKIYFKIYVSDLLASFTCLQTTPSHFFLLKLPFHCQPQIDTCHMCLPSTSARIKAYTAVPADLQQPLRQFRVESRNETLYSLGDWQDRLSDS